MSRWGKGRMFHVWWASTSWMCPRMQWRHRGGQRTTCWRKALISWEPVLRGCRRSYRMPRQKTGDAVGGFGAAFMRQSRANDDEIDRRELGDLHFDCEIDLQAWPGRDCVATQLGAVPIRLRLDDIRRCAFQPVRGFRRTDLQQRGALRTWTWTMRTSWKRSEFDLSRAEEHGSGAIDLRRTADASSFSRSNPLISISRGGR